MTKTDEESEQVQGEFLGLLKELTSGMDGGTQKFVSLGNVRNLNVIYPSDIEQDKIGCYFEKLDNLITLHQRKLEECEKIYASKNVCIRKGIVYGENYIISWESK